MDRGDMDHGPWGCHDDMDPGDMAHGDVDHGPWGYAYSPLPWTPHPPGLPSRAGAGGARRPSPRSRAWSALAPPPRRAGAQEPRDPGAFGWHKCGTKAPGRTRPKHVSGFWLGEGRGGGGGPPRCVNESRSVRDHQGLLDEGLLAPCKRPEWVLSVSRVLSILVRGLSFFDGVAARRAALRLLPTSRAFGGYPARTQHVRRAIPRSLRA